MHTSECLDAEFPQRTHSTVHLPCVFLQRSVCIYENIIRREMVVLLLFNHDNKSHAKHFANGAFGRNPEWGHQRENVNR